MTAPGDPPRLAIVATHPIQYHAPLYRRLVARAVVDVKVFFGWEGLSRGGYDPGFQRSIHWDVPLLEGYPHEFLPNDSGRAGSDHFMGIRSRRLIPRIESWRPHVVLINGWRYASHLAALRHFSNRIPLLFRGDSTLLDERPGVRTMARRAVLKWVYAHVNLALHVGRHNAAYFQEHGLTADRLWWAPHAVDETLFADPRGEYRKRARQWRTRLGIEPGDVVFLFAGKLEPKKDPLLLLSSFRALAADGSHLLFVGNGRLEGRLRQEARGAQNIHFLPFQNQSLMPVMYRMGDVFVLPSRGPNETWGLAVNEAMTCGRPVIVSDRVGCAPDLVRDGTNGYVVPAGRTEPLLERMARFVTDPGRIAAFGRESEAIIGAWSIGALAARLEEAVLTMVRPGAARSNGAG